MSCRSVATSCGNWSIVGSGGGPRRASRCCADNAGRLMPKGTSGSALDAPRCRPREIQHAIAHAREPLVSRVSVDVAVVELLNDDRDLEEGEDLEVRQRFEATAALRGVAIDQLVASEPPWSIGDRGQCVALLGRRRGYPVGQEHPQIHQRLAE